MNEIAPQETSPEPKESGAYLTNRDYICVLIAAMQILGGLFGIWLVLETDQRMSTHVVQGLILIPFPWAVYGGYRLLRNRPSGVTHSLIIQLLQIPVIASAPFSYSLFIGISLSIGAFGDATEIRWFYGAASYMNFGMGYSPPGLAINVIALAAFAYLIWVKTKIKRSSSLVT